jgi:hypothetical protein
VDEYEHVRDDPRTFVGAPGHQLAADGETLEETERYVVLKGRAGRRGRRGPRSSLRLACREPEERQAREAGTGHGLTGEGPAAPPRCSLAEGA